MLTKDILFDMNILTLAGFLVMGLTLTLNRMGQTGKALSIGRMVAGTALVFLGLYAGVGRDSATVLVAVVAHQHGLGADPVPAPTGVSVGHTRSHTAV